jgi:hypothetical protein
MLVVTMLAAAPLAAQQPMGMGHEGAHSGMMGHGGGMAMMPGGPGNLLRHAETLGLTVPQVGRLTKLYDEATTEHDAAAAKARTHHEAVQAILKSPKPDTAEARRHFRAAHAAMGEAHWAMLRAALRARWELNDVQRARVDGWTEAWGMGHGGGGHGHPGDERQPGPHHPPR